MISLFAELQRAQPSSGVTNPGSLESETMTTMAMCEEGLGPVMCLLDRFVSLSDREGVA
jgi:hypothetical protein